MLTIFLIIILKSTIFCLIIFLNFIIETVTNLFLYNTYNKEYFFSKYSVGLRFLQRVNIYHIKIRNQINRNNN